MRVAVATSSCATCSPSRARDEGRGEVDDDVDAVERLFEVGRLQVELHGHDALVPRHVSAEVDGDDSLDPVSISEPTTNPGPDRSRGPRHGDGVHSAPSAHANSRTRHATSARKPALRSPGGHQRANRSAAGSWPPNCPPPERKRANSAAIWSAKNQQRCASRTPSTTRLSSIDQPDRHVDPRREWSWPPNVPDRSVERSWRANIAAAIWRPRTLMSSGGTRFVSVGSRRRAKPAWRLNARPGGR